MIEQKRILGIDYGAKRVGIAITDPLRIFAYGLTTIANDLKFWDNLKKIFTEFEVELIVLGYPLKESGARSSSTELIEKFKTELEKEMKIPIELVDERYSSSIAKQQVLESVTSKKKRRNKGLIDKNAAAIILQDYLEMNQ
ncbi:MAG: Holliday junction resolvase RuvX [Melioribacteraceae bacterium]|nr:Holliday junction resolvase RuvX [Melioribacteraceae bacterium]